ncbi:Na/Pi symporter [Xanthobacter oligotrophicus]|uniref:Na/Pi symporter n=1 Tax=Xanthobacter oligotrophicus TaxID=2607286 RepID=UPI0011F3E008|nr:Na/Pi symporter [Xanthobacter oligotrophicus]MCG5234483.1 Na/Pi symporter [Xanthobacter oligotrophicus]
MAIIAQILAGLGLLFVGLKIMSTHLQQATGRRVRHLLRTATRSPFAGLLCGTLAGAATQSSNAVAVISGNLVRGGVLATRDAIPIVAGGNVGTAALVFVAAIDFRLLVLYLVAMVGFGFQFKLDRRPAFKEWMGVALGLALVLLGLDYIKQGPRALDVSALAAVLDHGISPWVGFLLGLIAAAVSQSSSTPTILVVALMQAQVLGLDDSIVIVMGANLGSGISAVLTAGELEGTGRQLCYVHVLVKAVGCLLVGAVLLTGGWLGAEPVALLSQMGGGKASASLSLLFLALQVAGAVPVSLARGVTEAIAARLSPPTMEDGASKPRFIHERALGDFATALDLAEQEIMRLVKLLPTLLPDLDQQDQGGPAERLALWRGANAIGVAIDQFLSDLIARGVPRGSLQTALQLQALVETVRTLQDTLHAFTEVVEGFADLPPLGFNLSESLRTIILSLADATDGDAEDLDFIITLAGDRSDLLSRIRRQLAASALGTGEDARQLLLATSLFERGVWLVRRSAVALRAPANEANPVGNAVPGEARKREEADAHRT